MRIEVDMGLCQGHGVCESEAPGVFEVSKETKQVMLLDPSPSEDRRAEVEMAVRYCPTGALKMVEDDGRGTGGGAT